MDRMDQTDAGSIILKSASAAFEKSGTPIGHFDAHF